MEALDLVLKNVEALDKLREMRNVNTTKVAVYLSDNKILRDRDGMPYSGKWIMNSLKSKYPDENVIKAIEYFYRKYQKENKKQV